MTGGYEVYVELARKLCDLVPVPGPCKAVLFNSGAEAVENAIKIARRATGTCRGAGLRSRVPRQDAVGAVATSKTAYKEGFGPVRTRGVSLPDAGNLPAAARHDDRGLRRTLQRRFPSLPEKHGVAVEPGVRRVEPILGEGGFLVPPVAFLEDVARVCRDHGIVLVADEVQTGFGRTGKMFACEHTGLQPDLVVLAKSLSNGLPLSAVVGRAELLDAVPPGGLGGTFGGNPVACAAALGAIETLEKDGLVARAAALGSRVGSRFRHLRAALPFVGNARGVGAMRALEIVTDKESRTPTRRAPSASSTMRHAMASWRCRRACTAT